MFDILYYNEKALVKIFPYLKNNKNHLFKKQTNENFIKLSGNDIYNE